VNRAGERVLELIIRHHRSLGRHGIPEAAYADECGSGQSGHGQGKLRGRRGVHPLLIADLREIRNHSKERASFFYTLGRPGGIAKLHPDSLGARAGLWCAGLVHRFSLEG
jgi:hypothetical protein